MDDARAATNRDEFPAPRKLRPTYEERRATSLSRAVCLSRARQKRKRPCIKLVGAAAVAVLALVLVFKVFGGALEQAVGPSVQTASAGNAAEASSTPRWLWVRSTMPCLFQTDPEWADRPYATGTIATHGCGPTCLSMVYVQLTGKRDRDPARMAEFSEQGGYIDPSAGVTSWALMSEGARQLGLSVQEVPADADMVHAQLRAGNPVICSVGPGDFTDEGHFIALCGLDADGRAIVHDPNSPDRTQQPWDLSRIIPQCRNLWAFAA